MRTEGKFHLEWFVGQECGNSSVTAHTGSGLPEVFLSTDRSAMNVVRQGALFGTPLKVTSDIGKAFNTKDLKSCRQPKVATNLARHSANCNAMIDSKSLFKF